MINSHYLSRSNRHGFTLIELLIVIAIILILIAIALPNYMRSRIRAQLTRLMADMKTEVHAIEAYWVDNNSYLNIYWPNRPPPLDDVQGGSFLRIDWTGTDPNIGARGSIEIGAQLTTPVSYIDYIPADPFWSRLLRKIPNFDIQEASILYWGALQGHPYWASNIPPVPAFRCTFWFQSPGPNLELNQGSSFQAGIYDPTNGVVSDGDLLYLAPYGFMGAGHWNVGNDYRPPGT